MIRFFDILFSLLGILILSPLLVMIYLLVAMESRGGGFYIQKRVGRNGVDFKLLKFRSMRIGSDKNGLITVGERDPRMTKTGAFIRRFKLDELPQLFNVLKGDMSLVGPRPELRYFVNLYTPEQRKVLSVRPGITDYASIEYVNENFILGSAVNPEKVYVEEILPDKIRLNMKYIQSYGMKEYFRLIFLTLWHIIKKN
ncbi:sugar transferase [Ginsengibacter hankyongi]|uniref:Sugar transferase n=1 Tax=Ginsengibacter hankyongi TaxID=2607284 RepID=A0A5J5IN86_9BACT|nr:sugar transferase [Ginsengibacter hankyongi]KAA9041457.1 sugar transferase [Ginsengibacter hankyongi]